MWLVLGHRVKTVAVEGGHWQERECPVCGEYAVFYEHRTTRTLRLYFVDVFDYRSQRVMACGACGELYATDEYGGEEEGVGERLGATLSRMEEEAVSALDSISERLSPVVEEVGERLSATVKRVGGERREEERREGEGKSSGWRFPSFEGDREEEDREEERGREERLLERFEELERRSREKAGER